MLLLSCVCVGGGGEGYCPWCRSYLTTLVLKLSEPSLSGGMCLECQLECMKSMTGDGKGVRPFCAAQSGYYGVQMG